MCQSGFLTLWRKKKFCRSSVQSYNYSRALTLSCMNKIVNNTRSPNAQKTKYKALVLKQAHPRNSDKTDRRQHPVEANILIKVMKNIKFEASTLEQSTINRIAHTPKKTQMLIKQMKNSSFEANAPQQSTMNEIADSTLSESQNDYKTNERALILKKAQISWPTLCPLFRRTPIEWPMHLHVSIIQQGVHYTTFPWGAILHQPSL